MAATSDDDVPTGETATGHDESPDGDTTAAAAAPATTVPSIAPDDEDEEDRTVQQHVDPKLKNIARSSALAAAAARPPPPAPAPPMRMTSKKPTAVGLGSPLPVTRPAAGFEATPATTPGPPPVSSPATSPAVAPSPPDDDSTETIQTEADVDDESITTTAPAPRISTKGAPLPLTLPGTVQIRELPNVDEDDSLDETEVRTVVSGLTSEPATQPTSSSPIPAAGRPSEPPPNEADEPDDSVTTQAPAPVTNARLPEQDDEPKTSPPARLSPPPKPIPAAGRRPGEEPPFTVPSPTTSEDEDTYDADESVTTRGPAVPEYEDDSVTAQAPVARPAAPHTPVALGMPPTLDDGTDGTTKKVAKRSQLPAPTASADAPSDEDAESITTQAPGHLTNMLRVIATPEDALDSDDSAENKTAVMLGAPVKPPGAAPSTAGLRTARPILTGSGGQPGVARAAAIADLREPSSDSGLRVARAEVPSGDHASLSALMSGQVALQPDKISGAQPAHADLRNLRDASPATFANTEQAFNTPAHPGRQPSLREFDFGSTIKKPRYGLLVGLVAVLSFTIPLVLFLWLHQGMADDTLPRTAAEVEPDLVARGDSARPRATKGTPTPSSTPSTQTPTNGGGNRGPWFPRRR